jgi:hypothetical protein
MIKLIELVRRNWPFFLLATIAALALRLFFVFRFPHVAGDTWVYGDIAKNWLAIRRSWRPSSPSLAGNITRR